MEAITIYFLKSAALMSAFFLAYYFLLRKETFFNGNRWYLILALLTSVVLPLITFKKVVWVEAQPVFSIPASPILESMPVVQQATNAAPIDWFMIVLMVYFLGFGLFLIKFTADCYAVYRILKGRSVRSESSFKLVDVTENVSPFSFFNFIVYNSQLYTRAELRNIIAHEKVHCRQKHTIDVLIAQMFCIVFWWNPIAWLHKKAILQNLEFIADSEACKNISDIKSYQFTLLKITTHNNSVAITNHFYQSLIKKRIVMLNKNQSKKWNALRYAFIVPVIAAFMFYFQVNVVAQERPTELNQGLIVEEPLVQWTIDKNSSDAELAKATAEIAEKYGIEQNFTNVRRNAAGEITSITSKTQYKNGEVNQWKHDSSDPIGRILLTLTIEAGGEVQLHIKTDEVAMTIDKEKSTSRILAGKSTLKDETDQVQQLLAESKIFPYDKNYLMIINGKEYFSKDLEDRTISLDGTIIHLNEVDAVTKYGERARAGAFLFNGPALIRVKSTGELVQDIPEIPEAPRLNVQEPQHPKDIKQMELSRKQRELSKAQREISRQQRELSTEQREISKAQREKSRAISISRVKAPDNIVRTMSNEEAAAAKAVLELARLDMEQAKKDIEQAERDLEQARIELEQNRKKLDEKK